MKKISLENLKIKSFVTSIDKPSGKTINGGFTGNDEAVDSIEGCDIGSRTLDTEVTLLPTCSIDNNYSQNPADCTVTSGPYGDGYTGQTCVH